MWKILREFGIVLSGMFMCGSFIRTGILMEGISGSNFSEYFWLSFWFICGMLMLGALVSLIRETVKRNIETRCVSFLRSYAELQADLFVDEGDETSRRENYCSLLTKMENETGLRLTK